MENKAISPEELAYRTGHYPTLSMALAMAMTRCFAWRFVETGDDYSALQLFDFVQKFDASHKDDGRSYFLVSSEGAIGVSSGMEYQAKWLFIPLPPSAERNAILEKMNADIAAIKAETLKASGV